MELSDTMKKQYIRRVHDEERERSSTYFTDVCYAEEQLIDYCDMIADALIRYGRETAADSKPEQRMDEKTRQQIHMLFRDKYEALGLKQD